MLRLIIIVSFLTSFSLFGLENDYKAQFLYRSFPTASFVSATIGTSYLIWDQRESEKHLYGFTRTSLTGQTSLVVNSYKAQVDLYPISILGFYGGLSEVHKNYTKLDGFSCLQIECNGKTEKSYIGTRWAIKVKNLFATGDHKVEWLNYEKENELFAEEQSTLIGRGRRDTLNQHLLFIGHSLSDNIGIGPLLQYSEIKNLNQNSMMENIAIRYGKNNKSILIGSGIFRTREDRDHFTIWFLIGFDGDKGALLF